MPVWFVQYVNGVRVLLLLICIEVSTSRERTTSRSVFIFQHDMHAILQTHLQAAVTLLTVYGTGDPRGWESRSQ